jgi:hypothetical protein
MTARFSVKNSHIEDDLILVFKKQTHTVKVITVRLKRSFDDVKEGRKEGKKGLYMKEGRKEGRTTWSKEGKVDII